jgi:ubiquinone/menaquinone biosynthesis C-methylase UbiE
LREAGINPHALKPFEDAEKYISFLERPDRAVWQKPDALVSALGLTGNETVADVGAGSGYFSFRFAKALPRGKVVAIDVAPEMIRHIHHRAMSEGVTNVQVIMGDADDPRVPADAGLIFVCDVLHHVKNRPVWLSNLHREVGNGAKLVVVEFKQGDLPEGPPASRKLARDEVVRLVSASGFSLASENETLLPYQYVLTFQKN